MLTVAGERVAQALMNTSSKGTSNKTHIQIKLGEAAVSDYDSSDSDLVFDLLAFVLNAMLVTYQSKLYHND